MEMTVMGKYAARADAAREALQALLEPGSTVPDLLRTRVNTHLEAAQAKIATVMGCFEGSATWEEVEMEEGRTPAEALAAELGITTPEILDAMRTFALEHAAFKIYLSTESERDSEASGGPEDSDGDGDWAFEMAID